MPPPGLVFLKEHHEAGSPKVRRTAACYRWHEGQLQGGNEASQADLLPTYQSSYSALVAAQEQAIWQRRNMSGVLAPEFQSGTQRVSGSWLNLMKSRKHKSPHCVDCFLEA